MPKRNTLSLLFLITSFGCFAQFNFGIKGGLTHASYATNFDVIDDPTLQTLDYKYVTGYQLGVFSEFQFNSIFSLKGEFLFSSKGAADPINSDLKTKLYYLSLPLHFQVKPIKKLQLLAGLEPAYSTSTNTSLGFGTGELDRKFDLGLSTGISYRFLNKLGVNFRYVHGLTSLYEITFTDNNGNPLEEVKFKNKMFALSIEYFFKGE